MSMTISSRKNSAAATTPARPLRLTALLLGLAMTAIAQSGASAAGRTADLHFRARR